MLEFFYEGEKVLPVNLKSIPFFVIFTDKVLAIGLVCILRHIDKAYKTLKNSERLKNQANETK